MDSPHLLSLAERVEAASGPDRELDCLIAVAAAGYYMLPPKWEGGPIGYGYRDKEGTEIHPGHGGDQLVKRYTASIDAAMTLVDAEWFWRVGHDGEGADPGLFRADVGEPVSFGFVRAVATTPALALCAAALKARASQSHSQTERGEA